MKVVKLTSTELNKLIKKVIREQEEEQLGTTGPAPEEVTGAPEAEEGGEPDYEGFLTAAKELLGQGISIGELVDKLIEAQNPEEPEPEVEPTEPDSDTAIPSDNQ